MKFYYRCAAVSIYRDQTRNHIAIGFCVLFENQWNRITEIIQTGNKSQQLFHHFQLVKPSKIY